jgi:DNA helicase II / ATP-dependent DNA helicase PcrA
LSEPERVRQAVLTSEAAVRLLNGEPGVGKTYFGCEIAENWLRNHRNKVLFLTFARNAVARIRQVYAARILDQMASERKQETFEFFKEGVRIETFAGFFWWLVESYGRYIGGGTNDRLWFMGSRSDSSIPIPPGYRPCTFDDVEADALTLVRIPEIRDLLSKLYPLVIIDEFQDVHDRLFDILCLLSYNARLVLLNGPGQCIYRSMKQFSPDSVLDPACSPR